MLGDNFVGKHGGAIFVQDIIIDGDLVPDCTITTPFKKTRQQQARRLIPSYNFQDSTSNLVEVQELDPTQKKSYLRQPSTLQFASPLLADSLMVECMKLSCNPAGKALCFAATIVSIFSHQKKIKYKFRPLRSY